MSKIDTHEFEAIQGPDAATLMGHACNRASVGDWNILNLAGDHGKVIGGSVARVLRGGAGLHWHGVPMGSAGQVTGNCYYATMDVVLALAELPEPIMRAKTCLVTGLFEHVGIPSVIHAWIETWVQERPLAVNVANLHMRPAMIMDTVHYLGINRCQTRYQTLRAVDLLRGYRQIRQDKSVPKDHESQVRAMVHRHLAHTLEIQDLRYATGAV